MNILKGKSTRTKIFTVITILVVVLTIALTLVLNYVGMQNTLFLDLTHEGLYTLTDVMKKECAFVEELDEKIEIIFCTDPDRLISQTVTRVTYYMSVMLDNAFENVEVRTVNAALNPTAVSKYKTTSLKELSASDIIIAYGDRYRVVNAEVFWLRNTYDEIFSYNGEYKMASLFKSVSAYNSAGTATAYFLTGHGETYYDEANPDENRELLNFIHSLEDAGLKIKNLDLSAVDSIPADCALLIINNPTSDFEPEPGMENSFEYVSPLEKIDRYLVSNYGSLIVAKDFERELPLLEEFLGEWGFEFVNALVKDESNNVEDAENTHSQIIGSYNTDEDSYGMAIYSEYVKLGSAPKFIVPNTGYIKCTYGVEQLVTENGADKISRIYSPFLFTSDKAIAYSKDADGYGGTVHTNAGRKDLVGVTVRKQLNDETRENKYSYVMCANSADFLTNAFIGSSAYANYDILSATALNATRSDEHASMELGGSSLNSPSYGGKIIMSTTITTTGEDIYDKDPSTPIKHNYGISTPEIVLYSIFIFLVPVTIAVVGIVIRIKRKYL